MFKKNFALLLFAALIFIDQLSKFAIRHFGGFYICNAGIAFGIRIFPIIIYAIWIIIIALLLYYFYKKHSLLNLSSLLLLSGGISNLIDRFAFGCVTDFIDLHLWPIFNLADIFIFLGAIILLAKLFKK